MALFISASWAKFYVWYVEPPPRIRLSAPKPLVPLLDGPASDALPRFLNSQELMKQRLENANGIDIVNTRITSPFASFVKMNLFTLFSVGAGHGAATSSKPRTSVLCYLLARHHNC